MPRRPIPETAEDRALREVDAEDTAALDAIARQSGPPPDSNPLSEADEDRAWQTTDPSVDYEQMAQQIMTQGLPPQASQNLLILKLRPDWAPLYAQPTQDAEQAHVLTRAAQFPFRLALLDGIDDPEELVRTAERIDRRVQKRLTQQQEQVAGPMLAPPAVGG